MFVFFSIGNRAYPPGLRLRISTKALDPLVGQTILFMACEQQDAAQRRQAWTEPLTYFAQKEAFWGNRQDEFAEFEERPTDKSLRIVRFDSCQLEREGSEQVTGVNGTAPSMDELRSNFRSATGL